MVSYNNKKKSFGETDYRYRMGNSRMRLIYILGNKYTCTCHKISDHFTVFFCSTGRGRNESETKIEKRAEGFLERCYTTVTETI